MAFIIQKFKSLKITKMVVILFLFMTYRTLASSESIQFTWLCAGFLPFFSQQSKTVCMAEDISEEKEVFGTYIVHYIVTGILTAYLYVLYLIGVNYIPGYGVNVMLTEILHFTALCNLFFIGVLVPLVYAMDSMQRLLIGGILAIAEVSFMFFAIEAIHSFDSEFITQMKWILYLDMFEFTTIPFQLLGIKVLQKRKLLKNK